MGIGGGGEAIKGNAYLYVSNFCFLCWQKSLPNIGIISNYEIEGNFLSTSAIPTF